MTNPYRLTKGEGQITAPPLIPRLSVGTKGLAFVLDSSLVLRASSSVALILLLMLALSGCGGKDQPVAVEGVVTLDGEPVEGATVLFKPQDGRGRPASGLTDSAGVFVLTTFREGDGVLPGSYLILVTKTEGRESAAPAIIPGDDQSIKIHYKERFAKNRKKSLLPARYGDESKTPLSCTVPPGERVRLALQSNS